MIIRKIRMINFRGFRDKTIDFKDKSVVLLSAANGIGKTTTVDAIEWCLTGNIGRLKTAFDTRSTNDADRKMNTDGILKNRDAGGRIKVKVFLWLFDGKKEILLCREQTKDELNPKLSKVTIDRNEKMGQAFIREYVGDSFYNFHFCDVQKSFNVQSKKRKDLKDFFGEFITNYDEQKQIAENLDLFAEDVDRYIEDKIKQKVPQRVIENYKNQLDDALEKAKQVSYPLTIFYSGERTEIADLNKEELTAQKKEVENCGYQVAIKEIYKVVENECLKSQQSVLNKIASYWKMKEEDIRRAVKIGFSKNTDAITTLEMKLRKLKGLSLSKDTIFKDVESMLALKIDGKPIFQFTIYDYRGNALDHFSENDKKQTNELLETFEESSCIIFLIDGKTLRDALDFECLMPEHRSSYEDHLSNQLPAINKICYIESLLKDCNEQMERNVPILLVITKRDIFFEEELYAGRELLKELLPTIFSSKNDMIVGITAVTLGKIRDDGRLKELWLSTNGNVHLPILFALFQDIEDIGDDVDEAKRLILKLFSSDRISFYRGGKEAFIV